MRCSIVAKGARSPANGLKLNKQLGSQQQLGEKGTTIAGQGAGQSFRDSNRVVKEYGGNVVKATHNLNSGLVQLGSSQIDQWLPRSVPARHKSQCTNIKAGPARHCRRIDGTGHRQ